MSLDPTLESRLRDLLERDAADAPIRADAAAPRLLRVGSAERGRRRNAARPTRLGVAFVATAAAAIGVIVVLRSGGLREASVASEPPPAAFRPVGTEVRLAEVDAAAVTVDSQYEPSRDAVKPGSESKVEVAGHPPIRVFTTIGWQGQIGEVRCYESIPAGGGCSSVDPSIPAHGETLARSVDLADVDLRVWWNVPAAAAYVAWSSPGGPIWQRPIAGFVGLPFDAPITDDRLIAYDVDGNIVAEASSTSPPPAAALNPPTYSGEELSVLAPLAELTMADCVATRDSTWDSCVAETKQIVDARYAEMIANPASGG